MRHTLGDSSLQVQDLHHLREARGFQEPCVVHGRDHRCLLTCYGGGVPLVRGCNNGRNSIRVFQATDKVLELDGIGQILVSDVAWMMARASGATWCWEEEIRLKSNDKDNPKGVLERSFVMLYGSVQEAEYIRQTLVAWEQSIPQDWRVLSNYSLGRRRKRAKLPFVQADLAEAVAAEANPRSAVYRPQRPDWAKGHCFRFPMRFKMS